MRATDAARHPGRTPDERGTQARGGHGLQRRRVLAAMLGAAGLLAIPASPRAQGRAPVQSPGPTAAPAVLVEVWKSPTCGCCKDWITHLEAHGFRVKVHDVGNTAARARLKVPMKLGSCHTAWVGGYAIEGHVPAADIQRLLKRRHRQRPRRAR
jgi:hypothetical protein